MEDDKSEKPKRVTRMGFNSTYGASFYTDRTSIYGMDKTEKEKMRILKKVIV